MVSEAMLEIRAKILGVLLRDAREAAGKSLTECGAILGISSRAYKAYETGKKAISLPELEILAYFIDASIPHFWGSETLSKDGQAGELNTEMLLMLRRRLVGARLRRARTEQKLKLKDVATPAGISSRRLSSYELGDKPIPLPELEVMAETLGLTMDDFAETEGPIAAWARARRAKREVEQMSPDMQIFVADPLNRPYLELARQLSTLPGKHMRELAESLLEITY